MSTGGKSRRGALFTIIGLLALAFAAWQAWGTWRFLQASTPVQGVVLADPGSTSPNTEGHPTIAFRTPQGEVRYRQNGMGSSPVGQAVQVRYDPRDPSGTAQVMNWWTLWSGALLPAVIGTVGLALGIAGAGVGLRGRY